MLAQSDKRAVKKEREILSDKSQFFVFLAGRGSRENL